MNVKREANIMQRHHQKVSPNIPTPEHSFAKSAYRSLTQVAFSKEFCLLVFPPTSLPQNTRSVLPL
jgi:hypothetical protein